MGAIDEGLGQIDLAAVTQVRCERLEDLPEHAVSDPLLHPAMTGLVRRILTWQRFPRSSGPKDPEHPVEDASRFDSRTTLAVFAHFGLRDQRLDNTPLLVSELHVLLDHIRDSDAILPDHVFKNRSNFGHLPMSILRCVLVWIPDRRFSTRNRPRPRDFASLGRAAVPPRPRGRPENRVAGTPQRSRAHVGAALDHERVSDQASVCRASITRFAAITEPHV